MTKQQIDQLLINVWHDCYTQTYKACIKEWGIDFTGKDKGLVIPPIPEFPDTQDEVIKVVMGEN